MSEEVPNPNLGSAPAPTNPERIPPRLLEFVKLAVRTTSHKRRALSHVLHDSAHFLATSCKHNFDTRR